MVCLGCQKPEESAAPVAADPVFPGKMDSKLVGTWELTSAGKSIMWLKADGTSRIVAEANSPGGKMKSDVGGEWRENSGKLLMKRVGPDKKDFVVDYDYALNSAGDQLTLSRAGRRAKQVCSRSDKD